MDRLAVRPGKLGKTPTASTRGSLSDRLDVHAEIGRYQRRPHRGTYVRIEETNHPHDIMAARTVAVEKVADVARRVGSDRTEENLMSLFDSKSVKIESPPKRMSESKTRKKSAPERPSDKFATVEGRTRQRLREDLAGIDLTTDPNATKKPVAPPSNELVARTVTAAQAKPKVVAGQLVSEKDVNRRLAGLAKSIKSHRRKAVEEILLCGQCLQEAQQLLATNKTGTFSKWLESKVGMGRSSAYRMIQIFERFGNRPTLGRYTDADAIRQLAAAPEAAASTAIALMEAGEMVDLKKAKELIAAAKPAPSKTDTVVHHLEFSGGVIVIRSALHVDPRRALMEALKNLDAA